MERAPQMAAKKKHDAQRIMAKHPGHMPVICVSDNNAETCKLLVPGTMKGAEFVAIARAKCKWGQPDSNLLMRGAPLEESLVVSVMYDMYKSSDGFLYVSVNNATCEQAALSPAASSTPAVSACKSGYIGEAEADSGAKAQPQVFHMPDNDRNTTLSADALKAKKVLRKYPDRVPVLVKQAASAGLPELDKKLLVPRQMTCAGLRDIMPKHLGCANSEIIHWHRLGLYMGDVPLKDGAIMSDVYNQYVDENDGGLHVTVKIDLPAGAQMPDPVLSVECAMDDGQESHRPGDVNQETVAMQSELDALRAELETTLARASNAENAAAAAEQLVAVEQERALVAEQNVTDLGQVYLAETKKNAELEVALQKAELQAESIEEGEGEVARLREVVEAKLEEVSELKNEAAAKAKDIADLKARLVGVEQELEDANTQIKCMVSDKAALEDKIQTESNRAAAAEEAAESALASAQAESEKAVAHAQRVRDVELQLMRLEKQVESELQQKLDAQAEARALSMQLATTSEELEKARKENASVLEQGPEGFVHLGWDNEGFAAELEDEENEFEVLAPSEHNLSTLRYAQRASFS